MATQLDVTRIPAPRVPILEPNTGAISREWYRFFENLFLLTGGGSNPQSLSDLQKGPPSATIDDFDILIDKKSGDVGPSGSDTSALIAQALQSVELGPLNGVELVIGYLNGLTKAPVTKTADFAVELGETWIINNKAGSSCTVTLPPPAAEVGRELHFQNYQDQTLVSASSNVVPLAGGAAATSILLDVAGAHATLVSDGTNWVMTQYGPNNALLLE
jgi:hypothetical protein